MGKKGNDIENQKFDFEKEIILKWENKKLKFHIFYVAIITTLIVSAFLAFILLKFNCRSIIEAITSFATILSIILSISSISYSYITSHDTSRQFGEIDKTVAVMSQNSKSMDKSITNLENFMISMNKDFGDMRAVITQISKEKSGEVSSNNELETYVTKGNNKGLS